MLVICILIPLDEPKAIVSNNPSLWSIIYFVHHSRQTSSINSDDLIHYFISIYHDQIEGS